MNQIIPLFKNTQRQLGQAGEKDDGSNCSSTLACKKLLSGLIRNENLFFTKSCTQSLELAVMILDLPHGSEVILPSYGFVSLANAVAMFGHKCVFVDCEIDTLNISADAIEAAITDNTKAVITINYGGIPCDYERISDICRTHNLWLIEDNAHGLLADFNGTPLGSFGDISTFSFDFLKMITCYEGGAIAINNESLLAAASSCLDMGTNRSEFRKGKVSFYEWTSLGTNSMLAQPLFDILQEQLLQSDTILKSFVQGWRFYEKALKPLSEKFGVRLPHVEPGVSINGYIFWMMTRSGAERDKLIARMQTKGITLSPHYSALHVSQYGKKNHSFSGRLQNTEKAVGQMLRLPLFYGITAEEQQRVVSEIEHFYSELGGE